MAVMCAVVNLLSVFYDASDGICGNADTLRVFINASGKLTVMKGKKYINFFVFLIYDISFIIAELPSFRIASIQINSSSYIMYITVQVYFSFMNILVCSSTY